MFKHILLPTDGSEWSEAAVNEGLTFAKSIDARVTVFHVVLPFHVVTFRTDMLEDTRRQYEIDSAKHAEHLLAALKRAAAAIGVDCETCFAVSEHPYEAILKATDDRGCDLIVMASHGYRGLKGLLLGSETLKVLTHSSIPVMVFHAR